MNKRKVLSWVLALVLVISNTGHAFAMTEPTDMATNVVLEFDSTNAHVLHENNSLARGTSVPTEMYNLSGATYYIEGEFKYALYTEKYFYSNAAGQLYYKVTAEWPTVRAVQGSITVECWDLDTNEKVTSTQFFMEMDPATQVYGPKVSSGNRVISNLTNTHKYCLRILKTDDKELATLTGSISHE